MYINVTLKTIKPFTLGTHNYSDVSVHQSACISLFVHIFEHVPENLHQGLKPLAHEGGNATGTLGRRRRGRQINGLHTATPTSPVTTLQVSRAVAVTVTRDVTTSFTFERRTLTRFHRARCRGRRTYNDVYTSRVTSMMLS